MRSKASANAVVRTFLAVIFGFMSLFHAPIMASANAVSPAAHHHLAKSDAHATDQHMRHHVYHGQQSTPAVPDAVPSCYGIGCFVVLEIVVAGPPAANLN